MPIRKMACSVALGLGLFGAPSSFGQMPAAQNYPDFPSSPTTPAPAGEYRMLRGQAIQLSKPANSSNVNAPPAVLPPLSRPTAVALPQQSPPVMPIPTYSAPARYTATVAVPEQAVPVSPSGAGLGQDPRKDDPKTTDGTKKPDGENSNNYKVNTELPTREVLYLLEGEQKLEVRIRNESGNSEKFPPKPVLSSADFQGRAYPRSQIMAESNTVCHGKLLFEERNAERYGWDLGFIQPLVSLGYFTKDVIFLPYHLSSRPHCQECAPRCLPGDQVPYMIYHEGLTITGVLGEAGVIVALAMIFP